MIDAFRQMDNFFQGRTNDLILRMELEQRSGGIFTVPALHLKLSNSSTLERFHLTIDKPYLQANQQLSAFFQTPQELLYYLRNQFDHLAISQKGQIRFMLETNKVLGTKREFTLVLKKAGNQAVGPVSSERIRQLEQENSTLMRKVLSLERGLEETVAALRGQQGRLGRQYISNHPKNIDPDLGVATEQLWGTHVIRITKLTDPPNGEWNSFIGAHSLDRNITFKITVGRLIEDCLWFGVGTNAVFKFVSFNSRDFLSFNFKRRSLCVSGQEQEIGFEIGGGALIEMEVDRTSRRVAWWANHILLAQAILPAHMQNQELFFCLFLRDKHDWVQVSLK